MTNATKKSKAGDSLTLIRSMMSLLPNELWPYWDVLTGPNSFKGVVCIGGSWKNNGYLIAQSPWTRRYDVAERRATALRQHYLEGEQKSPGFIKSELERMMSADPIEQAERKEAELSPREKSLRCALQIASIPICKRSVEQSLFLLKAVHAGLVKDCGYHPMSSIQSTHLIFQHCRVCQRAIKDYSIEALPEPDLCPDCDARQKSHPGTTWMFGPQWHGTNTFICPNCKSRVDYDDRFWQHIGGTYFKHLCLPKSEVNR